MLPRRLRAVIPLEVRRTLRRAQRVAADAWHARDLRPPPVRDVAGWPVVAAVEQAMDTTPGSAPKQHNIALAAAAFSGRPVAPGGLFSFWGWMGSPSSARGYREGRALRDGVLVQESGGGLCQLSGAIYFAGLQAGLRALERHAHSVDLYTDETRFAPLGSDATVSFGFKDLRLRNPHPCRVAFDVRTAAGVLHVAVRAEHAVAPSDVSFRRSSSGETGVAVDTWVDGALAARTVYKPASSASAASPV